MLYTAPAFRAGGVLPGGDQCLHHRGRAIPVEVRRACTPSRIGYTAGASAQLAIVYFAARRGLETEDLPECPIRWREILMKPAFFVVYAAGIGLNITFTRAYATHAGPGMAAALDYCMRGVAVPMALLVQSDFEFAAAGNRPAAQPVPVARSAAPDRQDDRAGCAGGGGGMRVRARSSASPAIALLFQHGSFTAESTRLVASAFLALGPSLIGWSLMEILARSLFALDRPWPPVIAAFIPVLINVMITLRIGTFRPEYLGLGASARPDGRFRGAVRDRAYRPQALAGAGLKR